MCNHGDLSSLTNMYSTEYQVRDFESKSTKPQFSATIDLDSVRNGNNPSNLICDEDDISDLYSNVCRKNILP